MDAVTKTDSLRRELIPVEALVPNPDNPNVMNGAEFDLLCDNMQKVGFTDPVLVRPIAEGKFRIVGGHHRYEAAKYLEFKRIPCTVIDDPNFDDEQEEFQLLRHNLIRGKLDPQKFAHLYHRYAAKYDDETLKESFGFTSEAEFRKLIDVTKQSLPKQLQKKFDEAAKELKTLDGLSTILNRLFTEYGNTLPYHFMIIEYGKKESLWIRAQPYQFKRAKNLADWCQEHERGMDSVLHLLIEDALLNEQTLASLRERTVKVEKDGE